MNKKKLNNNNTRGKPYNFKGINIYPVKVKDGDRFYNVIYTLQFNQKSVPDATIIKSTYLTFLFLLACARDESNNLIYPNITNDIIELLEIVLHKKFEKEFYFHINENKQVQLIIIDDNKEIIINKLKFEKIKKIIFYQNDIPYDEEYLADEVLQAIAEAREIKYMSEKDKIPTFEDKIISYHCAFKMSYEEIDNLTLYQFNKGLQRMGVLIEYLAYDIAKATGLIECDLDHWTSHIPEQGIYDDVIIDESGIQEIKKTVSKI